MRIKKMTSLLLVLSLIITLFTGCKNNSLIQLNVKKGDSYKLTQQTDQKITFTYGEQSMDMVSDISISYIYTITDVDSDGATTINVKFDSLKQKQSAMGTTIEFDSSKPSDKTDEQNLALSSIIGQEFSFVVNKDGKVLSIDGLDKMFDNILTKIPNLDETTKASLSQSLKQIVGQDSLKTSLSQSMDIYPSKEVKTGDAWEKEYTLNSVIPMKINSTMKLNKIADDVVNIDVNSKINTSDSDSSLTILGVKMNFTVSGDETGTLKIDKNNGFIQTGEFTDTITGNAEMDLQGQSMSLPIKMDAKTTYTSEKLS